MIRRQIKKLITWEDHGSAKLQSLVGGGAKKYSETFIFNPCLIDASISVRAKKEGALGNKENFIIVNICKKKLWGSFDDHDTFIVSLPVGHVTKYNQSTNKLGSLLAGEEVKFEIYNPGPDGLNDIEIEITQDILLLDENASSNVIGLMKEGQTSTQSRYQKIDRGGGYFIKMSPFVLSEITKEIIDGQEMVRIPKFYFKMEYGTPRAGYSSKKVWLISDRPVPGFVLHPAFMHQGKEIDQFWVGAYEASKDGDNACSLKNVNPWQVDSFSTAKQACEARNTGGVEGFHMLTIYELAAIQILCFIETGDAYVQHRIGEGNCNPSSIKRTGSTNAVWKGIFELWGNTRCLIDGIKTEHSGQKKIIHLYDEQGNFQYVNTGVSPATSSGKIAKMKETSGSSFDFRKIFIPDIATTNSGMSVANFANDYHYTPSHVSHTRWAHGVTISGQSNYGGLFTLLGHLKEDGYGNSSKIGFRLAKV